jgi:hypothetical protein
MLVKYEGLEARCRIGKITERLVLAHGPHNFCEFSRTTTRRLKNGCFCAVWSVTQVQDLCLPQQRQPAPQYRCICERASCAPNFPSLSPRGVKKIQSIFFELRLLCAAASWPDGRDEFACSSQQARLALGIRIGHRRGAGAGSGPATELAAARAARAAADARGALAPP